MAAAQPTCGRLKWRALIQVGRQPGGVEPGHVAGAEVAGRHRPQGRRAQQRGQAGEPHRRRVLGGGWRPVAIEADPERGGDEAGKAGGEERAAPAQAEHQRGDDRRGDRRPQRRGGVEDAARQAPPPLGEPAAHHPRADRELRRLADAERHARGDQLRQAGGEPGRGLRRRPQHQRPAQQPAAAPAGRSARRPAPCARPHRSRGTPRAARPSRRPSGAARRRSAARPARG